MEKNVEYIDDFIVEKWLDANPSFLRYYINSRPLLNNRHSISDDRVLNKPFYSIKDFEEIQSTESLCNRYSNKNANQNKLIMRSIASFESLDETVSIIRNSDISIEDLQVKKTSFTNLVRSEDEIQKLEKLREFDIEALLNELIQDIGNETNMENLCLKILVNVCLILNCDRCSLFLVEEDSITGEKMLVAKVFDANINKYADLDHKIKVPFGVGIIGIVAKTGKSINLEDAYQNPLFNQKIDQETGYKTQSVICHSIKNTSGTVIGVAEAINKLDANQNIIKFSEQDEKIFEKYLTFCGIIIINAQLVERYSKENEQNNILLNFAKVIFEDQDSVVMIIDKILINIMNIIKCQTSNLYLKETESKFESFKMIFSVSSNESNEFIRSEISSNIEEWRQTILLKINKKSEILFINMNDLDVQEYGITKIIRMENSWIINILYIPVKDKNDTLLGILELINPQKISKQKYDQRLFEAFGIFCGMALMNTRIRANLNKAIARQQVSLEVLSYHATISDDDITSLMEMNVPSSEELNLNQFEFDDITLGDTETCIAVIRIFKDLNFINTFEIDYKILCRWILTVKKNYRLVTYHNWRHAFNVTQFMYCLLKNTSIGKCFNHLEKFSLIVGSLCHDLDHRGINNSFLHKAQKPLSILYTTSTMEYHHFDHAMMLLKFQGNEILKNLSEDDTKSFFNLLREVIIATDLGLYIARKDEFRELAEKIKGIDIEKYFKENDISRSLLRAMLITSADISGPTKPWKVQKRIASLVTEEFFQQGDMEKNELNSKPSELMDREYMDKMPKLQVGFIESICLPLYSTLSELWPELLCLEQRVKENSQHWKDEIV